MTLNKDLDKNGIISKLREEKKRLNLYKISKPSNTSQIKVSRREVAKLLTLLKKHKG